MDRMRLYVRHVVSFGHIGAKLERMHLGGFDNVCAELDQNWTTFYQA